MSIVSKWFKERKIEISNMLSQMQNSNPAVKNLATSRMTEFLHSHINSENETEQHLILDNGVYKTPDGEPIGGGGGGTSNYNALTNRPQINGVTLQGDLSASDLELQAPIIAGENITIEADGRTINAKGGIDDPSEIISLDTENALTVGTDGNLFVPAIDIGCVQSVHTANGEELVAVDNSEPTEPKIQSTITLQDAVAKAETAVQPDDITDFITENDVDDIISTHNTDTTAHNDIRQAIPDVSTFVEQSDIDNSIDTHNVSTTAHSDIRGLIPDVSEYVKQTDIDDSITTHNTDSDAHSDIRASVTAVTERVDGLENLGNYLGAFDTFADVPTSVSDFTHITVNDFVTVRADETHDGQVVRYVVSDITGGNIVWQFDVVYSTDISGKADLVQSATNGNLAGLDGNGNLTDSGKSASDFIASNDATVVRTTGAQTIDGNKRFNDRINIRNIGGLYYDDVTSAVTLSSDRTETNTAIRGYSYLNLSAGSQINVLNELNLRDNRIVSIAPPVDPDDATSKIYVEDNFVDLGTDQHVGGDKTFTGLTTFNAGVNVNGLMNVDANISMTEQRIVSLGDPVNAMDAVNRRWVEQNTTTRVVRRIQPASLGTLVGGSIHGGSRFYTDGVEVWGNMVFNVLAGTSNSSIIMGTLPVGLRPAGASAVYFPATTYVNGAAGLSGDVGIRASQAPSLPGTIFVDRLPTAWTGASYIFFNFRFFIVEPPNWA